MKIPRMMIFRCLWAVAILFHYHWTSYQFADPFALEVLLAAITSILAGVVLIFPNNNRLFILLLSSQIIDVALISPFVPNHWLLCGLVSLTFLGTNSLSGKSADHTFKIARSSVIAQVAIFYFFTFFWKLNTAFLDPNISCGVVFFRGIQQWLPFVPQSSIFDQLIIYLTLLVELLLPFLLLRSKTRTAAMITAFIFHFALALHLEKGFLNFSAVMYALLFLYAPDSYLKELGKLAQGLRLISVSVIRRAFVLIYSLLVATSYFSAGSATGVYIFGRELVWLLYSAPFLVTLFFVAKKIGLAIGEQRANTSGFGKVMILAVILNGFSPIIGIKTGSSWQMYSNIQINAKESNHLLLPRSLDFFGYLSDTAEVVSSDLPELSPGGEYPTLEIRRAISGNKANSLSISYHNQALSLDRLRESDIFSKKLNIFERKITRFHRSDRGQANLCSW